MEELKFNIIETASVLFMQKGCRTISMDDVCAELRMSKKTLYTYFPKKEDLIEAVLLRWMTIQREYITKKMTELNSVDFFVAMTNHLRKSVNDQPYVFIEELKKYYPRLNERFEEQQKEFTMSSFSHNLKKGIEEGYFREDLDIELLSLFHAIQIKNTFEMMKNSSNKYTKKRLVEFFIDVMVHLIANEKGLKYIKERYNSN